MEKFFERYFGDLYTMAFFYRIGVMGAARSGMPTRGVRPPGQKTWKAGSSTRRSSTPLHP